MTVLDKTQNKVPFADKLKSLSEDTLRMHVHSLRTPWNETIAYIGGIRTNVPDLLDNEVNLAIKDCERQGFEIRDHIVKTVRMNPNDRDYEELAYAVTEFRKYTRLLKEVAGKIDDNLLAINASGVSVDDAAVPDRSTIEPIVIVPPNEEADEPGTPSESISQDPLRQNLNWSIPGAIQHFLDRKSPAGDSNWVKAKEAKRAKKRAHA